MGLTEYDALQAYARMMNTLSIQPLENLLAEDFVYESQYVLQALESKQEFLAYMISKLQTIARANATVYAEMGTIAVYGRQQPCVIMAQNEKSNLVGIVLANVKDDRLKRLDLCMIPAPEEAERSGDYPS